MKKEKSSFLNIITCTFCLHTTMPPTTNSNNGIRSLQKYRCIPFIRYDKFSNDSLVLFAVFVVQWYGSRNARVLKNMDCLCLLTGAHLYGSPSRVVCIFAYSYVTYKGNYCKKNIVDTMYLCACISGEVVDIV